MNDVQARELLDSTAAAAMADRHLDLDRIRRRARQRRRRAAVGVGLSGTGVAACVALAVAVASGGAAPEVRTRNVGTAPSTSAGALTWTTAEAPRWTPKQPGSPPPGFEDAPPRGTPSPLPSIEPSPSPDEVPRAGDVPAYLVPATMGLTKAEAPEGMTLSWDEGPTLDRATVLVSSACSSPPQQMGETLAAPPIGGRVWHWGSTGQAGSQTLEHSVTAFAAGTGHERFVEVRRKAQPCFVSDRDLQLLSGSGPAGTEAFILSSTMVEQYRDGWYYSPEGQFVLGVARVGDVLVSFQLSARTTRAEAVQQMKGLLDAGTRHVAAGRQATPAR